MASIRMKGLVKRYGDLVVVPSLDLEIDDREFVVFVGPSGCGKSTLLRVIAGLEPIDAGELYIGDRLVNGVSPSERDIAMVFQDYALYPHMTVHDNMAFGLEMRAMPKDEIQRRVQRAAGLLHIEPYLKRKPKELSGGQRQRVAMGRAMVRNPKVFLFDEPLSNLDAKLRGEVRTEIKALSQQLKTTMVFVTHDQIEAMTMADRIVVLSAGVVQQFDTPEAVYKFPANQFVAGFIGSPSMNFFEVRRTDDGVRLDDGSKLALPPARLRALREHNGPLVLGVRAGAHAGRARRRAGAAGSGERGGAARLRHVAVFRPQRSPPCGAGLARDARAARRCRDAGPGAGQGASVRSARWSRGLASPPPDAAFVRLACAVCTGRGACAAADPAARRLPVRRERAAAAAIGACAVLHVGVVMFSADKPPRPRLVCLGLSAFDLTWSVDALPVGGGKTRARGYREGGGGMAANAAVAAARLGAEVQFWGRAGDDSAGAAMRESLAAAGVGVDAFRLFAGARSSVSGILVDAQGERAIVNFRGAELPVEPGWLPLERIAQADAVLADPRWPQGALALFDRARRHRVPTVLDGDVAEPQVLDALLPSVDYAVFSEPGLAGYARRSADLPAQLRFAHAKGARFAAVTLGERGVAWFDGEQLRQLPAYPVEVIDTTGAGDVFHGALAFALGARANPRDALQFSAAVAALKCAHAGGRDGSPGLNTALSFIKQHEGTSE